MRMSCVHDHARQLCAYVPRLFSILNVLSFLPVFSFLPVSSFWEVLTSVHRRGLF
jgi:hypothetical protein